MSTTTAPTVIEGVDTDAEVPCGTVACRERGPRVADLLVRMLPPFDELGAWAFPICRECFVVGTEKAAVLGLPAYRVVEVLR